ncbi:hypothetical protein FEM08_14580 [Flavobacterium gilvum]|nr:hypothetical protein FEM08_14580 [Flavobacterium gilvum]
MANVSFICFCFDMVFEKIIQFKTMKTETTIISNSLKKIIF